MDARLGRLAARAAEQHNVVSLDDFAAVGVSRQLRAKWIAHGVIHKLGVRTFGIAGAPRPWEQGLVAGLVDIGPESVIAGRSGAALHGLDGFERRGVELLVPRRLRNRSGAGRVAATTRPILATDVCRLNGVRCLRAERLILEAPLFDFTRTEVENAIDSALRLHLVAEDRLRARVQRECSSGVNGGRALLAALVDAGGHSALERAFLGVLRAAGLPRPALQVTHRVGNRIVARVDTLFSGELVIEVDGHATHSSRRQRQIDAQRRTELTVRGQRVLNFTYDDVTGRPGWTADRIREALSPNVA